MSQSSSTNQNTNNLSQVVATFGYIIAISYPLLSLSTGVRAVYQIFFRTDITNKLGPALTAIAALIYLLAAVGFIVRKKWAWQLSVRALALEMLGVLVVGTLSFATPLLFEHTSWRYFGMDYGFFPLLQPIIGLIWLWWPETRRIYSIHLR
jgi:NhaP-type Na+/H+ and K+/H+ antiporter